ncbi:hypothetical protein PHYC_03858 [Phycisphaerales bacterium]|nr:hypothetical protein PHYC_03858 [Phycisphaerales bacterium]
MKRQWAYLRWGCTAGAAFALVLWAIPSAVSLNTVMGYLVVSVLQSHEPSANPRQDPNPLQVADVILWTGDGNWSLWIPLWYLAAVLGFLAAVLWTCRILARRKTGAFPACNYSLTGLAPGSPCPECGRGGGGGDGRGEPGQPAA